MTDAATHANFLVVGPSGPHTETLRRVAERMGAKAICIETPELWSVLEFLDPPPELLLIDASATDFDAPSLCTRLQGNLRTRFTPLLLFNAPPGPGFALSAFNAGAQEILPAPFDPAQTILRVRLHRQLHQQRLQLAATIAQKNREAAQASAEVARCLRTAAEFKDDETGCHTQRVAHSARLLAKAVGLDDVEAELIFTAAPLHDVGHIGIPDRILFKPTALTPDEWRIIRMHPGIGAGIIGKHDAPVLKVARRIALTHHEKWDGSGYPRGLKGENIPLAGRIVGLCDTFDVLTSERPHKPAWPIDDAVGYVRDQAGKHFDPQLVALFLELLPQMAKIRQQFPQKPAMLFDLRSRLSETLV